MGTTEFRVKPAFDSNVQWDTVESFTNYLNSPISRAFTYSEGFTQSITKTIAQSQSAEISLSLAIERAVKGIGLSASEILAVMNSFWVSYERTDNKQDHVWSVGKTVIISAL